jgi:nucleotide-binding universal stress UspA family protein
MILLCYDGSEHAQIAVDRAAQLFPRAPVTVLCVWEPFIEQMAEGGFGAGYPPPIRDVDEIDAALRDRATKTAEEGADRARHAGMAAEPRVEVRGMSVTTTIIETADAVGADAIVLGSRGLGAVKSVLMGSVSHGVVQNSRRPVLVVPLTDPEPG